MLTVSLIKWSVFINFKVDFKTKNISRNEGYFKMKKQLIRKISPSFKKTLKSKKNKNLKIHKESLKEQISVFKLLKYCRVRLLATLELNQKSKTEII